MPGQNSSAVQDQVSRRLRKDGGTCDAEQQPPVKSCGFMEDVEQKNLRPGYHLVANEEARALTCAVRIPADFLAE